MTLLLFAPSLTQSVRAQTTGWQQHVRYDLDVSLLADRHRMRGTERLHYTNNSPDTLRQVFYHLYFNAFNPNSMMAERNRQLPDPDGRIVPRIFNLGPDEVGYHRIRSLTQDGEPLDYEITDTVVRVELAEPILPGETTTFRMRFHSQVPLQTRRSGRDNDEGIDYSMTQWYPKIAEYDEHGWHADPYVGREFYGVYGSFDVDITLPARYTIGATGALQNADAIGHGYDASGTYRTSEHDFAGKDSLTWRFHAENVHDFAWAADPDYIHENIQQNGQRYHLLYQPDVEKQWARMNEQVPQLIAFYGDEVGPYPYPQFTVAQGGDGGMEYPMIVLITGRRSSGSVLGVTAHESAHEWFYGILGSNESDYAWMDEGFTTYISTESMAHLRDRPANHIGSRISYLYAKDRDLFEPLNTPADWYTTNLAYSIASYPGGAMFVDMLGYVIGDEQQSSWLHTYYDRFKFRHPEPENLEKIAEDVSGLRLDWYFEQFLDMNRSLDYELDDLETERTNDGWQTRVEMEREDEVAMPVDLKLTYADGSTQWINIPLGIMQGHKPVPDDWIVAEPWLWTFPEYTFEAVLPKRVVSAEIDPKGMTPDENRLNNTADFPLTSKFLQPPGQSWFEYSVGYRPLAQYANDFGPGVGMQARGQYLFGDHKVRAMLKLWPQVLFSGSRQPELESSMPSREDYCEQNPNLPSCTGPDVSFFDGIDYEISYSNEVSVFGEEATATLSAQKHLGILENRLSFTKPLHAYNADAEQHFTLSLLHQFTPTQRVFPADGTFDLYYEGLGYPTLFNERHYLSTRLDYSIEDGRDHVRFMAEVGGHVTTIDENRFAGGPSALSATRFSVEAAKTIGSRFLRGQAALQFGMGSEDLALQKGFRFGAASFEERWQNDAFRSVAAAFNAPRDEAHLVTPNGYGPTAYLLSGLAEGSSSNFIPIGGFPPVRNIVQGRLSVSSAPFSNKWLRPFEVSAFSGAGTTWNARRAAFFTDSDDLGRLIADAGLGARYDISALRPLRFLTAQSDVLQDLTVVAQFPFWASDPKLIEPGESRAIRECDPTGCYLRLQEKEPQNAFAFRWLLGIRTGL